ncbi:response regulator [Lichenifustis flavocetrariae]|uniref:response regulator n=1 Tax=Lichenifustis flavocetrariae TaxID=2949735 RepID=UPI0031F4EC02
MANWAARSSAQPRVDQALAIIGAEDFDAAILDVNLNGEKSYPVADALATQGVPFVFSTGYGRKGVEDAYLAFPMLRKPYKRSTLGDALSMLLIRREGEAPQTKTWPAV